MSDKLPKVIVDGDTMAYRAAYSCQDLTIDDAIDKVDDVLLEAIQAVLWDYDETDDSLVKVFLTGKGNFRYDIAKAVEYKGNRKSKDRPEFLDGVRKHLIDNWNAEVSENEEADDLVGIWATKAGPETIVISIDKDMLQIPCWHYNPNRKTLRNVSETEGLRFFYSQILTGDNVDNIIGLYGIGPKKAEQLLGPETDKETDLFDRVVEAYSGDVERVIENARLLWLRRYEGQIWEPPIA